MSQTLCCVLWMHHFINHSSRLLRLVVLLPSVKLRRLSHRKVKWHAQVKWLLIVSEFRLRSSCPQSLCLTLALLFLYMGLWLSRVLHNTPNHGCGASAGFSWPAHHCGRAVWPVSSTPAARVNLKLPKGPSWSLSVNNERLGAQCLPHSELVRRPASPVPTWEGGVTFLLCSSPKSEVPGLCPRVSFFDHTQSVGNFNAEVLRVRANISHLLTLGLMDGDWVKGFFWNWFIRPRGFPSRSLLSLLRFMCLFNIPSAYWSLSWKLSLRPIFPDSIAETLGCCSFSWKNAPNGLRDWCNPWHPDWWWGGFDWRIVPGRRGWGLWALL